MACGGNGARERLLLDREQGYTEMGIKRWAVAAALGALLMAMAIPALAWDGTDENGNAVEIDSGNLVRAGEDITYYNDADGQDHDATVDSITRYGGEVVIEVTDDDTGYSHVLSMEDGT